MLPVPRRTGRGQRGVFEAPGQNGVRERAFGSPEYEKLCREHIDDALDLIRESDAFRVEFNTVRLHEHLA